MIELLFAFHGLIGAFLATLFWSEKASDLKSYKAIRNYLIGAIAGYIYFWLHSEYNFPNALMTIVFGYFGKDILESLFERFRKKIES